MGPEPASGAGSVGLPHAVAAQQYTQASKSTKCKQCHVRCGSNVRTGQTRQDKTRQDKTRQDKTRQLSRSYSVLTLIIEVVPNEVIVPPPRRPKIVPVLSLREHERGDVRQLGLDGGARVAGVDVTQVRVNPCHKTKNTQTRLPFLNNATNVSGTNKTFACVCPEPGLGNDSVASSPG